MGNARLCCLPLASLSAARPWPIPRRAGADRNGSRRLRRDARGGRVSGIFSLQGGKFVLKPREIRLHYAVRRCVAMFRMDQRKCGVRARVDSEGGSLALLAGISGCPTGYNSLALKQQGRALSPLRGLQMLSRPAWHSAGLAR
jgi:hypothetical protein